MDPNVLRRASGFLGLVALGLAWGACAPTIGTLANVTAPAMVGRSQGAPPPVIDSEVKSYKVVWGLRTWKGYDPPTMHDAAAIKMLLDSCRDCKVLDNCGQCNVAVQRIRVGSYSCSTCFPVWATKHWCAIEAGLATPRKEATR